MRAFYIQAINISSRVVGDDDTFGSICEFDGRAFRGCCAMWASVGPSQSHAFLFPAISGKHIIACYYCILRSPVFASTQRMIGDKFGLHIGEQVVKVRRLRTNAGMGPPRRPAGYCSFRQPAAKLGGR